MVPFSIALTLNNMPRVPKRSRVADGSPPVKDGKTLVSLCASCSKECDTDCVECDWCGNWQHGDCASLSSNEIVVLADLWEHQSNKSNVMFFCSVCKPKVTLAMKILIDKKMRLRKG